MHTTNLATAASEYRKAYHTGKKEGGAPPVLDQLLKEKQITPSRMVPLGIVQIPIELISGTKTAGRSTAFSKNFYPLLEPGSEFSAKWTSLYQSHMEEGIRDPVVAWEFMNHFYIEEGNKRVSVLKTVGAVSVTANVTRIIPPYSWDDETQIYYEFMEFNRLSNINYIYFNKKGCFASLQHLLGKKPNEFWTDEDRIDFNSVFNRFSEEYLSYGNKKKLPVSVCDAFLHFIGLFDYHELIKLTPAEIQIKIKKVWDEFYLSSEESVELQMDPSAEKDIRKPLLSRLIPINEPKIQAAFIHEKSPETSGWTYSHELGRMHLQDTFAEQIQTTSYNHATEENALEILEQAIAAGNNLIFTTSPPLLKASVTAALEHPDVKILNCSLNSSYRCIRTYYARIYEARFLLGAIAGSLAESGKIGYVADYPILGTIAGINAFALGAKMINPRAKIYLEWSTQKDRDIFSELYKKSVEYIAGPDIGNHSKVNRKFGLYPADLNRPWNIAAPVWHWGLFYEKMIRNIMKGSWKYDDTSSSSKGLNYWWGMSSGIVDVICSHHLPIGTIRLIELLKRDICNGTFQPFSGILYSQNDVIQRNPDQNLSPEDIIRMDWLAENIIGSIPSPESLLDKAAPVIAAQGLKRTINLGENT